QHGEAHSDMVGHGFTIWRVMKIEYDVGPRRNQLPGIDGSIVGRKISRQVAIFGATGRYRGVVIAASESPRAQESRFARHRRPIFVPFFVGPIGDAVFVRRPMRDIADTDVMSRISEFRLDLN